MDTSHIDLLGLDRVLRRGTGEVIEAREGALFIRDSVSGAYFLGCSDGKAGAAVLDAHLPGDIRLLMVSDAALGREVFARYGFSPLLECRQAAYYGPLPETPTALEVRPARESDLPLLLRAYTLVSPEELALIVHRKKLLLGYAGGQLVGFVGEHLEGSMGLLYVFPAHRRKGYASALERAMIAQTMREGFVPFGQVEKSNLASLALQKKLGMTVSDDLICWMWK